MARWLVTGAGGLLGSNVPSVLTDHQCIGLVRSASPLPGYAELHSADLCDSAALTAAIRTAAPDVVLHAAALASHEHCESDPELAHRVNVDATAEIARACAELGAMLVYISTDAVFSGLDAPEQAADPSWSGYTELDEPAPFSVYGRTKLLGEQAARSAGGRVLVARTNFFGWSPSGTRSIMEFFVNAMRERRQVRGYTDFVVTSIYVRQLIALLDRLVNADALRLLEDDTASVVHVASRDALSKYAFSQAVAQAFDLDGALVTPSLSADGAHGTSRSRNLALDTSLLHRLIGTVPSQSEGLVLASADQL